jgi:histidinol-phosphatase
MLEIPSNALQTEIKSDNTPVTIADKTINHNVILAAAEKYPDIGVVGEEESSADYGMGERFITDPIDGTAAKLISLNSAMFSVGYVVDGVPMIGVTSEPIAGNLFIAVRGEGSFLNGERLQVSKLSFMDGLIAAAPEYFKANAIDQPFVQKLVSFNKELSIFPGAVFRSCHIATGEIAGFPHPQVKPYDIAAASLIVTEAGGKATNIDGSELDFSKNFRGAILSNGTAHDDLMALFQD